MIINVGTRTVAESTLVTMPATDIKSLEDLNKTLLGEIEHFFVSYNEQRGKKFKSLGHRGPKRARSLVNKHKEKPPRH